MNPVSRVSLHENFRTHELVEVLFLKLYTVSSAVTKAGR